MSKEPIIHSLPGCDVCMITVPAKATRFTIFLDDLVYYDGLPSLYNVRSYTPKIPLDSWSILGSGLAEEVTEDEAKQVFSMCEECGGSGVVIEMDEYIECCGQPTIYGSCCGSGVAAYTPVQKQCGECEATGQVRYPLASLHSLLSLYNMKPDTTVILVNKK